MSKLTIRSGKGELTLKKSKNLVGLKTIKSRGAEEESNLGKEVIKNLGGFNVVVLDKGDQDIDSKLDEVREKEEVDVGTHVYYAEGSDKPLIATGEIYIQFEEGVSEEEQNIILNEFALELVERRNAENIVVRVTPQSPNPLKAAQAIQQTSMVKTAEPDLDIQLDEYVNLPKDELLSHQWHLKNEGRVADANYRLKNGADSRVVDAWNRLGNLGSSDIVVAVIDNGFDLSHPDLKSKIYRPFDLWNQSDSVLQGDPRFTHGTPCASVAVAASNRSGIVGAAPNARFMPISGTSFSNRATEQMFDYCILNGADIISCSWGTTDPKFALGNIKQEAIARAVREGRDGKGCIVLYAVGNEDFDYVNFYAAHPDVIAVAACTSQDSHAYYSNRGREVTIAAPSNGDWPIIAGRAWWDEGIGRESGNYKYWRDGKSRGKYYKHFGGTSSSTPLVAGICALVLSANPDLTAKEVKEIITKTADKIGSPTEYVNGHSNKYGYGRINADRAVAEALRRKESKQPPVEVQESISSGRGLFRFSVERQPSQGWGVQIGAFYEYGNVLIQVEKLQRQFGLPVIVNINELKGKTVYKVVVGAYNSKDEASRLFQRMKNAGVNGFPRNLADLK